MFACGESTPWEAALSGARSVPGEGGWVKGSILVGGLPNTPMILVSQVGVFAKTITSTPGNMASLVSNSSPPIRAERVWARPPAQNLGGSVERNLVIPYHLKPFSLFVHKSTQGREEKSLAATREEIRLMKCENKNNIPEEKPQASSRSSILQYVVEKEKSNKAANKKRTRSSKKTKEITTSEKLQKERLKK